MAPTHRHIRLGTRGSPLALWQARWVAAALRTHHPGLTTELVVIRTAGDRNRQDPLPRIGGKGLFVKDIEDALLSAKKAISGDDREGIQRRTETLNEATRHLAEVVMNRSVSEALAGRHVREV